MGKHKSLFVRNEKILNLQKQGLMHEEIAEIIGCSAGIVGRVLRDNGIYGISDKGKAKQISQGKCLPKTQVSNPYDYFEKHNAPFEYHSSSYLHKGATMAKNTNINKLKTLAKQFGVEDNALFLTTLDRYIVQQRMIDMIKEELDNVDIAVSKEYVKGRENIYAHPLIKELPKHSDAANKTASLLLDIINKIGTKPKAQEDAFEAFLNGDDDE